MSAFLRTWAVAKKDMRVYYLKGPVIIFGLLFPGFLFLAFAIGRDLPAESLAPGLIAMALFFTSSAVTPAVLPFETRTRTLERLLAAPLSLGMLLGGDVLAAFLFGLFVSLIPALVSILFITSTPPRLGLLAVTLLLSALTYAILGMLFSSPPTDNPSSVMTISNLVRLPTIFFSGVFVPISHMPAWGKALAAFSPLTYTTEALRAALGQETYFPVSLSLLMLCLFAAGLWAVSMALHRRNMSRRLWM